MKSNKKALALFVTIPALLLPHTQSAAYSPQAFQYITYNTTVYNASVSETITFSDNLKWRYKSENGILYKRLYNYTTNCWVGNWIRC